MKPRPFNTTLFEVAGALSGALQDELVRFEHEGRPVELSLRQSGAHLSVQLDVVLDDSSAIRPFFVQSLETWAERVVRMLGMPQVPIGDPEFDSRFVVRTHDAQWALSIFDRQRCRKLIEWARCQPVSKLTIQCEPKRFMARRKLFVRPEMIVAFVGEALAIFDHAAGHPGRKDLLRGTNFRDPPSGVFAPAFEATPPVQRGIKAAQDLVRFTTLHVGVISEILESYAGQQVDKDRVDRLLYDVDYFSGLIAGALDDERGSRPPERQVFEEARSLLIALSSAVDLLLLPRKNWAPLPDKLVEVQQRRRQLVQHLSAIDAMNGE